MVYTAIVTAHIFADEEGDKFLEILHCVDDEEVYTGVFDDMDHAIMDDIDPKGSGDYYFMAIVKAEFVTSRSWEGEETDIEYEVIEIKSLEDVKTHI